MLVEHILAGLESVRKEIHSTGPNAADLKVVKAKAAQITRELNVLQVFAETAAWLEESRDDKKCSKRSASFQGRVKKMVQDVHGENSSLDPRLSRFCSLEIEPFLFVAASYTPVAVQKLEQGVFECIFDLAPQYVAKAALPPGWAHREEFQVAVGVGAKKGAEFKRKYHDLECTEEPKRLRLDTLEHPPNSITHQGVASPSQPPSSDDTRVRHSHIAQRSNMGTALGGMTSDTSTSGSKPAQDRSLVRRFGFAEAIETAFEIPPDVIGSILGDLALGESIMTIPTEDRVGSILHSIPREHAIEIGERYNLRRLPLSMSV